MDTGIHPAMPSSEVSMRNPVSLSDPSVQKTSKYSQPPHMSAQYMAARPVGLAGATVQAGSEGSDVALELTAVIRKQIRCSRTPNRTAEVLFAGTIMLCVHGPETLLASSMRNWPSFAELSNHVTWII